MNKTIALEKSRRVRWLGVTLVLLAALAAVAPELVRSNSCGHDFDFHLVSWVDALDGWRAGIPYPHWTPSANFGVGEPRFVFYPPLTWMLGAALGSILPWTWVPMALTFLLLAATGLGVRALATEVFRSAGILDDGVRAFPPISAKCAEVDGTPGVCCEGEAPEARGASRSWREGAATLAGCVAIFSGYALFTAYERTAFAELAGGLWMALLFKYALRGDFARGVATKKSAFDGSAAKLALVVAGAWLSNPTVAVMACYLLVALAAVSALLARSWAPVLRASVALVVGMGLVAVYLAPVVGEQRWADLNQVNLSPGQMLANNWLFARHADPVLDFHDAVLRQVSWIVVAMAAITLLAVGLCLLRRRLPGDARWWLPLALVPVAVLLLQLPFSGALWNLLPKLRYLQFPWRWLVTLEAPMGVFVAAAVWPRAGARWWRRWLVASVACVVFAGMVVGANRWFFQGCVDEDSVPGMMATLHAGLGYRGVDEYVPPGADNSLVAESLPDACLSVDPQADLGAEQTPPADMAPDDDLPPRLWSPGQGSCIAVFHAEPERARNHAEHFEVRGRAERAGFLILKLRSYPAWRVQVNGEPVKALSVRADGLLAVPVAAGPIDLTVDWKTTPDAVLGRAVSALSLLLLVGLVFLEAGGPGSDRIRKICHLK